MVKVQVSKGGNDANKIVADVIRTALRAQGITVEQWESCTPSEVAKSVASGTRGKQQVVIVAMTR